MFDLFELKPILRLSSAVKITTCVCSEDPSGVTLVMICDNYYILYYYIIKSESNCESLKTPKNVIIRQIPIDKSKGELLSIGFNEMKTKIITIDSKSQIFVIPIQKLISRQNDCLLRDDAILIDSCSLSNPTAIIWWTSLDQMSEIAIVGNSLGQISFIDINTNREIGGTSVQTCIKSLDIIDDNMSVSLVINCQNETQYRLVLEETRRKAAINSKTRTEANGPQNSDHYYFNCFMTAPEEREPIGPNNCWTFKPLLIDLFENNNINEINEIISTTVCYQNPSVLCVSEVMSEMDTTFGQIVLRLITNKEFDYSLSAFNAKYVIPKQSSLSLQSFILSDRLFLVSTADNCAIVSREMSDSRKLAKVNPIIQWFSFSSQKIINCFEIFKSNEKCKPNCELLPTFLIITNECLFVCHQKQTFHQLFHSIVTTNDNSTLVRAQRLTSMLSFNIKEMYEKSADICLKRRQFSTALRLYQLSKTSQMKIIANFMSFEYFSELLVYIQGLFTTKVYEIEDKERMVFANIAVKCLVQQLLQNLNTNEEMVLKNNLKSFLRDCLYYDESVVIYLLIEQGLFDLALYCAKLRAQFGLLLKYILNSSHIRSKGLTKRTFEVILKSDFKDLLIKTTDSSDYIKCFTSSQITYSLILHKELITKYMRFVVKLLPNLEMNSLLKLGVIFDPRRCATQLLLNRVLTQLKPNYLNPEHLDQQLIQKKDFLNFFIFITLLIIRRNGFGSDFNEDFISIQPFIKEIENTNRKPIVVQTVALNAGFSHSALIRNGCLYLWGKSQFGCCGLQSENHTNIPNLITSPLRLDLFKDVLSISVKSVSLGAQHSLVITDFGIYAFGSNRFGQLGLGKDVILSRNPIIISELLDKEIVRTECGQYHSLAISNGGVLWVWGWNVHGQLGLGHVEDIHKPQTVEYLKHKHIIEAFGGFGHTIALDSEGFVYSFGNGTYGQLGLGTNIKHTIPQNVSLLSEPIAQICTKYFHSLALSENNKTLYIWGSNPQLIRIQANYSRKSRITQKSNQLLTNIISNQNFLNPIEVNISDISSRITKICSGSFHSLLLTSSGEIYSFGRGIDGQLGQGSVKDLKIPTKIEAMNDIIVVDIATGSDYSLALDISGTLWGFGQNYDSQIGPKKSGLNQNCSAFSDKSKNISIKTNRRLITLVSGGKCVELLPIRINVLEDVENYCDSLNYSLDINAMKTSTRFSVINENINSFIAENSVQFDLKIIANLLAFYRKELDLSSAMNRFQSFKCNQMTAFGYELQNDFPKALHFQLQALEISHQKDDKKFTEFYTKIFNTFVIKSIESIDKMTAIFDIFFKFWTKSELSFDLLEIFLMNCYKNVIKDSLLGISLFNYLKHKQNISNKFQTSFLLEMIDLTIDLMSRRPEKLFLYQTVIERITSDIKDISFPTEKLWQNILTYFQSNNELNSGFSNGFEFKALNEEIIVFNCNHFYDSKEFKETIVSNFETDIKGLKTIENKDIHNIIEFYRDWDKDVWDCVCPQCLLNEFKSK